MFDPLRTLKGVTVISASVRYEKQFQVKRVAVGEPFEK